MRTAAAIAATALAFAAFALLMALNFERPPEPRPARTPGAVFSPPMNGYVTWPDPLKPTPTPSP
jgi:hypothetical protein